MRTFAAITGLLLSLNLFAAETAPNAAAPAGKVTYIDGKDYITLAEQIKPTDPSKIEVVEVFSYHCPHCMHFEPQVEAWAKKQPSDVNFIQLHTSWAAQMEPLQRGFYTLVALKMKDKLQMATFTAFQVEHKDLSTAQGWADFLSAFGVDKATVLKTYDSFGVTSQIKQADARTRGYRVTGTPEMIVEGKYRVTSSDTGSQENILKVVQFLVEKVRSERAHH